MLALRRPLASYIVVLWNDNILSLLELVEDLLEQGPIEHAWVIKVDLPNVGHLFRRALLVEAVERDHYTLFV